MGRCETKRAIFQQYEGTLTIEGRLTQMSRRLLFVDVTFTNQGELVAKADGSLYIVTFPPA
jgi:acyl-coenzyme A thioesterase PaaI-like protein